MKPLLTLFLLMIWNNSYTQIDLSVKEKFRGSIKSVSTIKYLHNDITHPITSADTDNYYNSITRNIIQFDIAGNPIKNIELSENYDTIAYCSWLYDAYGRIQKETYNFQKNEDNRSVDYSYENNGTIVMKNYNYKGWLYKTDVKYTDSLNHSSYYYVLRNGRIVFDLLGVLNDSFSILSYCIDLDGKKYSAGVCNYDHKNRMVSRQNFTPDSSGYEQIYFKYDTSGNQIEIIRVDKAGQIIELTKQYFNGFGDIIQIITSNPNASINLGYIERIKYTYDKHGNWINKTTDTEYEKKPVNETSKIIRTIEYY